MKKRWILLLLLMGCSEEKAEDLAGRNIMTERDDLEITLSFNQHENRYFGKAVNRYFGTYSQKGSDLHFLTLSSEMYSGTDEDMDTESAYFKDLKSVESVAFKESKIVLKTKKGDEIIFHLAPTIRP